MVFVMVATCMSGYIKIVRNTGAQLCALVLEVFEKLDVDGDKRIRVITATSDSEVVAALLVDLLTNCVESLRCVVHTLAMRVNDMVTKGTVWQGYMDLANDDTSYFNQQPKVSQSLVRKRLESGTSNRRM